MKHLRLLPTILSALFFAWCVTRKHSYTPKTPPRCYLDFTVRFDWEDSVYARNRAYFNSLRSSQQAEGP